MLITPAGTAAVTVLDTPSLHPEKGHASSIEFYDLATAKRTTGTVLPAGLSPVSINPDASAMILIHDTTSTNKPKDLQLLSLTSDPHAPALTTFSPYEGELGTMSEVQWAAFADNSHLLTLSKWGRLVLWQFPGLSPLWTAHLDIVNDLPGLSPNGKYAVVALRRKMVLLNVLEGKCASLLPLAPEHAVSAAFRPDGGSVAILSTGHIQTVDLSTNTVTADIGLPPLAHTLPTIDWLDMTHLLISHEYLVNLKLGLITWDYQALGATSFAALGGRLFFLANAVGKIGPPAITSVILPDAIALEAESKIDMKNAFVIREGSTISLDVHLDGHGDDAKLTQELTQKLAARHIAVAPNQPNVLFATVVKGKIEDESPLYRGPNDERETVTFAEYNLALRIRSGERIPWESTMTVYPVYSMNGIPKGGSYQQAQNALQNVQIDDFFTFPYLPTRVAVLHTPPGYGQSSLLNPPH